MEDLGDVSLAAAIASGPTAVVSVICYLNRAFYYSSPSSPCEAQFDIDLRKDNVFRNFGLESPSYRSWWIETHIQSLPAKAQDLVTILPNSVLETGWLLDSFIERHCPNIVSVADDTICNIGPVRFDLPAAACRGL